MMENMLNNSPKMLIYLTSCDLYFYPVEGEGFRFPLNKRIEKIDHSDKELLRKELDVFLKNNNIPKIPSVLLASDELFLNLDILEKEEEKIQKTLKKFLEEIPFEKDKAIFKLNKSKEKISLIGTNEDLFSELIRAMTDFGFKISHFVSCQSLWIGEINAFTAPEILTNIRRNKKISNFLKPNLKLKDIEQIKHFSSNRKTPVILLIILITALFTSFLVYYYFHSKKPQETKSRTNIILFPTPVVKAIIPTPLIKKDTNQIKDEIDKKELKIQILNGNGGDGVAGKGKDILIRKGYLNIETGNAGKYDYEKTLIYVKIREDKLFQLLKQDLEKDYEIDGKLYLLEKDSPYDAMIIMGIN